MSEHPFISEIKEKVKYLNKTYWSSDCIGSFLRQFWHSLKCYMTSFPLEKLDFAPIWRLRWKPCSGQDRPPHPLITDVFRYFIFPFLSDIKGCLETFDSPCRLDCEKQTLKIFPQLPLWTVNEFGSCLNSHSSKLIKSLKTRHNMSLGCDCWWQINIHNGVSETSWNVCGGSQFSFKAFLLCH